VFSVPMILPTRPALSRRIRHKSSGRIIIFFLRETSRTEQNRRVKRKRDCGREQESFNRKLWAETNCPFRDTQNTLLHTQFHNCILFSLLFPLMHKDPSSTLPVSQTRETGKQLFLPESCLIYHIFLSNSSSSVFLSRVTA